MVIDLSLLLFNVGRQRSRSLEKNFIWILFSLNPYILIVPLVAQSTALLTCNLWWPWLVCYTNHVKLKDGLKDSSVIHLSHLGLLVQGHLYKKLWQGRVSYICYENWSSYDLTQPKVKYSSFTFFTMLGDPSINSISEFSSCNEKFTVLDKLLPNQTGCPLHSLDYFQMHHMHALCGSSLGTCKHTAHFSVHLGMNIFM